MGIVSITVCRITVREMEQRIKKVDPKKRIDVKGFRMDSKETVSVPLVKSEMFLTELMEEICKSCGVARDTLPLFHVVIGAIRVH